MIKKVFIYGAVLALLTISLKLMEYKMVIVDHSLELYGGVLAVIFAVLGAYVGTKLFGKKQVIVEKTVLIPAPSASVISSEPAPVFETDQRSIEKLGISKREYEILELMARGCSNQEIADKAFVSVSTVKTHVSNLFVKLDVQRRTQAVQKARELQIIP